MPEPTDHELLAEFARTESGTAFATLVVRHVNLVYSSALRFTGNPHHAEEITQAVFIILARKAGKLSPRVVLSGWLYQAARLTAANLVKGEIRRHHREQEAYMQTILNEPDPMIWNQIAPLLDDAMGGLGETDRNAVVLRFFENKTAAEVAAALKLTEAAAHKRVNRALEKLRKFFTKRGVSSTTTILAGAISANSVQAAPAMLAKSVTAVAIAKGVAASGSTLILVKGALKLMTLAKAKTSALIGAAIVIAAGVTAVAVDDSLWDFRSYNLDKTPAGVVVIRPTHFAGGNQGGVASMLGKIGGRNTSFLNVICDAYDISGYRIIFDAPIPKGRFDYAVTATNQPQEKLQAEIKKQFGLVAHREIRETQVLLLKTNINNSSKMKLSLGAAGVMGFGPQLIFTNQPISELRGYLEVMAYREPVLDQTGLTGRYDFVLDWPKPMGYLYKDGQETLKINLANELGLELVPTNMPIEMLVVEKAQ
jgi:uncharacterized protein (TIGR03435 family)